MDNTVWLTRAELAERLKLPVTTLNQWASRRPRQGPPYVMFGRSSRYRLADVIAWENEQIAKSDAA